MTTETIREKLTEIITAGLVAGTGRPYPGALCVEAAICLALGEPHGDRPSCVAEPDRQFAIRLNDAAWSSPQARAEALLPLALAQLGTASTDRTAWVREIALLTVQRVLPIALRAAGLGDNAEACEQARTLGAAHDAATAARYSAYDAVSAAAYDAVSAAASAAASAAYDAVSDASDARYSADAARYSAVTAARYSAVTAARYSAASDAASDAVLRVAVECALEAYRRTATTDASL